VHKQQFASPLCHKLIGKAGKKNHAGYLKKCDFVTRVLPYLKQMIVFSHSKYCASQSVHIFTRSFGFLARDCRNSAGSFLEWTAQFWQAI